MSFLRRVSPLSLLLVVLGLVFGLAAPNLTGATPPPAGPRVWLFSPAGVDKIDKIETYIHRAGQNGELVTYNDLSSINQIGGVVYAGSNVSITTAFWLKSGESFDLAELVSLWTGLIRQNGSAVPPTSFAFSRPPGGALGNDLQSGLAGGLVSSNGLTVFDSIQRKADMYVTVNYNNLPNPGAACETITARGKFYNGSLLLDQASRDIQLCPTAARVNVDSGNILFGTNNPVVNSRILPSHAEGQTVVMKNGVTNRCDWLEGTLASQCSGNLLVLGSYQFNDAAGTVEIVRAKKALQISLNKVAQQAAKFSGSDNDGALRGEIISFLSSPIVGNDLLLYPRGRAMVVRQKGSISSDFDLGNSSLTVIGRKLLIFTGFNSVTWGGGVSAADPNIFGSVVVGGDQILTSSGPVNYDGAYIALSFDAGVDQFVEVGGSGGSATIKGLLVSDAINFTRAASGNTIATINYDNRFQSGYLLGLSPLIRPLVSESFAN